jgi:hypothetical protein
LLLRLRRNNKQQVNLFENCCKGVAMEIVMTLGVLLLISAAAASVFHRPKPEPTPVLLVRSDTLEAMQATPQGSLGLVLFVLFVAVVVWFL